MVVKKQFDIMALVIGVVVALVVLNLISSVIDIGFEVPITQGFLLMAIGAAVLIPFVLLRKGFNLEKWDFITLIIAVAIIIALIFFVPDLIGKNFTMAVLKLRYTLLGS